MGRGRTAATGPPPRSESSVGSEGAGSVTPDARDSAESASPRPKKRDILSAISRHTTISNFTSSLSTAPSRRKRHQRGIQGLTMLPQLLGPLCFFALMMPAMVSSRGMTLEPIFSQAFFST